MKIIKILDVNQAIAKLDKDIDQLQRCLDFLDLMDVGIERVLNMDGAFTGEGGEAIILNHAELQLPTIRAFRAHITTTIEKIKKMKAYILEFEPSESGVVTEDFWDTQMTRGLDKVEELTEQSKQKVDEYTTSVSHIMNLGKLDISQVLNRIDSSRKFASEVVDGLYMLDNDGVDLMAVVKASRAELDAIVQKAVEWTNAGGPLLQGVNIQDVRSHFEEMTLHKEAPDNPTLVKNSLFMQQQSIMYMFATSLPLTFQSTYLQQTKGSLSKTSSTGSIGEGKITYKWDGLGDKMQARGVPMDYKALGIEDHVETVKVNGYDVNYAVIDGQFILLRDNPNLEYYTQGAKTGKLEAEVAELASFTSYAVGAYATSRVAMKIPGVRGIADKHPIKSEYGGAFALQRVQNSIPIWKEIVGTPVPEAGTEQVLLYISDDDGENWDGKVMFTIEPNGDVKRSTDFANGFKDSVLRLLGLDKE